MNPRNEKEIIAERIAKELLDGDVVNLGIGLPTLVSNYISKDISILLQSENGILGMGALCKEGEEDRDVINAGNQYVKTELGACFFDSVTSFGIIRGGHVDVTVLGALQVDEKGNIASHMVPGKMVAGMGGAMDLVAGAKKVIVAMLHTAKGEPKILEKCSLPLTAAGKVNMIVTEKAVINVTSEGLVLTELMPGATIEDVKASTGADLIVKENLVTVKIR